MTILYAILSGVFFAIWRRCFGSDGFGIPVLKIRAVQHIIGGAAVALIMFLNGFGTPVSLIAAVAIQGLFWSLGHGAAFADMGRDKKPDESRYECWFKKYLDKIWTHTKMPVAGHLFYGRGYDFAWLTIRYTWPMILLAPVSLKFVLIGLLVAPMYSLAARYRKKLPTYPKLFLNYHTSYAEYAVGFIFGFLLVFA